MVLKYPELPLDNNDAELGVRAQVRKRDVSLHTMTKDGTKANDTFMTIVQTAKKLGVNPYKYIYDKVSKSFCMPSPSEFIFHLNHSPDPNWKQQHQYPISAVRSSLSSEVYP